MKNWKIDRIISVATLAVALIALILVLKKPAPITAPQTVAQATANAQSFQNKLSQLQSPPAQPTQSDESASGSQPDSQPASIATQTASSSSSSAAPGEVHITSDEVSAAIAQASGALSGQLSPNTDVGSMPAIKDQQVSFDGDLVHGQFLTNIAGKDVWVTISGHLGEKDGYATFDPTEFKVGDLNVPVSLVNGPLQKKLAEQRDRLKMPDSIGGMKVQDGELVLQQK